MGKKERMERIQNKIQSYQDQIMFIFFQVIMYVVDIGTDFYQAQEFKR